jgi:4-hydroxybenzoate polyprenyltransferase
VFELADDAEAGRPTPTLLAWLRLGRVPNVFTAIGDSLMGYAVVQRGWEQGLLGPTVLAMASAALYTSGMILNDWFDREVDLRERPFRPIPSGQVSPAAAAWTGFSLLIAGGMLGLMAGFAGLWGPSGRVGDGRAGLLAWLLAVAIVAYNGLFKATPLGPWVMGSCRLLNVAMGMAAGAALREEPAAAAGVLGLSGPHWAIAGGIGLYASGITWFARSETQHSRRLALLGAAGLMVAGIALFAQGVLWVGPRLEPTLWWLLVGLLLLTVVRRCGMAIADPEPGHVQAAVKQSILSLIWFDAAAGLAMAGPATGVALAALLIPALVLARWVYST